MQETTTQDTTPEDTRKRIISAAMQLFGQVGYAEATTRRIAKAAGVNEVTLFRHFGSKKGLLLACLEAFNASGFAARFEAELTGSYPDDILRMAHLQMQDTAANFEVLRLLLCDARHIPELREALMAGGRSNLVRLSRYFQRQIDSGIVRSDLPAEVVASAFDSLFSTYVLFEKMFLGAPTPELPAEEVIRSLVNIFVTGTQAAN
jgi:AcrR family transcriptional regulator